MARARRIQTSFASGELDPVLFGRIDLRAQEEGAARLRNAIPLTTGGVRRRGGTAKLAELPGASRLVGFAAATGDHLLMIAADRVEVLNPDGSSVASFTPSPWTAAQARELCWVADGERLLLCHPEVPPRELLRDDTGSWILRPWSFAPVDPADPQSPRREPFARFAPEEVRLQLRLAGSPPGDPIPAGSFVEILASAPVFTNDHRDGWLRIRGGHLRITNVRSATEADGVLFEAQPDGRPTADWREQALGPVRGWPRGVALHQNRLVIGGSRDLPDHVWISKSGALFDFDLGTGLDDEAIAFRLTAERRQVIRQVYSGRRLQIFTDAGEWTVDGEPLTPTSVRVTLQTRIGSRGGANPRPAEVDGATMFAGASGREVREFIFTDAEQAYQAADIALLSRHLVRDPEDMLFDRRRRLLLLLRADGRLATATIDRNSNVVAWALHRFAGALRAIEELGGEIYFLVERDGRRFLERWEEALQMDAVQTLSAPVPTRTWSGLGELAGRRVAVFADGVFAGIFDLDGPVLTLDTPASDLTLGIVYETEIEPVTALPGGGGLAPDSLYRPIRVSFRLHETARLTVDIGRGLREVPLPASPFTGDYALRAFGWRRGRGLPPWRILQETPFPLTLLSATTEIEVNR